MISFFAMVIEYVLFNYARAIRIRPGPLPIPGMISLGCIGCVASITPFPLTIGSGLSAAAALAFAMADRLIRLGDGCKAGPTLPSELIFSIISISRSC